MQRQRCTLLDGEQGEGLGEQGRALEEVAKQAPPSIRQPSKSLSQALGGFHDLLESPYGYLRHLKNNDHRKLVGCLGLHVPEEMIHAAGLIPVVLPAGPDPVTLADTKLPPGVCPYVRSVIDMAMKGQFDIFDGFVWLDVCPNIRGGTGVMRKNTPQIGWFKTLWFPQIRSNGLAHRFVMDEMLEFKKVLEESTGIQISSDRLQESIKIYNENRALLRMAYSIRRRKPSLISAYDMLAMVRSSMAMPKEEHTKLLRTVLEGLEDGDSAAENRQKLLISGSLCQAVPTELLDALNALNAVIVDDDLYVGSRYTLGDVDTLGDPVEALARRYLRMDVPCPTTHRPTSADWGEYLVRSVKESNARGVVTIIVKGCEPHLAYYPGVQRYLEARGIPELMLQAESETHLFGSGQVKTRLEAFVELLDD